MHDLTSGRERRDLRARSLRDMLAARLSCHPRGLGRLNAEVVAAMLEAQSGAYRSEFTVRYRARRFTPVPLVVTPAWDSRGG